MGESEKPKKASNVLGLVSISYSRQLADRAPRGGRRQLGIRSVFSLPSLKMTPLVYFEGNSSCLEGSSPDTSKFFSVKNLKNMQMFFVEPETLLF